MFPFSVSQTYDTHWLVDKLGCLSVNPFLNLPSFPLASRWTGQERGMKWQWLSQDIKIRTHGWTCKPPPDLVTTTKLSCCWQPSLPLVARSHNYFTTRGCQHLQTILMDPPPILITPSADHHRLCFIVPFKGWSDHSSGNPDCIQDDSRCNCITATISVCTPTQICTAGVKLLIMFFPDPSKFINQRCHSWQSVFSTVFDFAAGYFAYEGPSVVEGSCRSSKYFKTPPSSIDNPLLIRQHNPDNTDIFGDRTIGAFEAKYRLLPKQ